ncbi:hypothetical protein [Lactococcus petauri]|uniref:hypothetical protein n=1 Tax=Lactococcus petauri TaxID=1940789 RepID=UPI0038539559
MILTQNIKIKLKGIGYMIMVEDAATCAQCGQWYDIEEMVFEKGSYSCDECQES